MEGTNGDNVQPKILGLFYLEYISLHIASAERLPILTQTARNVVKEPYKPASLKTLTFQYSAKKVTEEMMDVFVNYCKKRYQEFLKFLNTSMSNICTIAIQYF